MNEVLSNNNIRNCFCGKGKIEELWCEDVEGDSYIITFIDCEECYFKYNLRGHYELTDKIENEEENK